MPWAKGGVSARLDPRYGLASVGSAGEKSHGEGPRHDGHGSVGFSASCVYSIAGG